MFAVDQKSAPGVSTLGAMWLWEWEIGVELPGGQSEHGNVPMPSPMTPHSRLFFSSGSSPVFHSRLSLWEDLVQRVYVNDHKSLVFSSV